MEAKSKYKNICEKEGVDTYNWSLWYKDWCNSRFLVEQLLMPLVQREFTLGIKENNSDAEQIVSAVEKLLNTLQIYKDNLDDFYTNQRKNIYLKYRNVLNGDSQEVLEVKSEVERLNSYLKGNLENIVRNLKNVEDKIFIQKWIKPIVHIEI